MKVPGRARTLADMTDAPVSPHSAITAADRVGLTGTIEAVCVVDQLIRDDAGKVGVTAINKRSTPDPVMVRRFGLHGDVQADRKNHGGEDKAVYIYAAEDTDWWSQQLDREIPPGLFGENLRVSGLDVDGAYPGERWRIGQRLVIEATRPRIPCATFGRWMEEDGWVKRFLDGGRPGTYFRVITPGEIQAGDVVEVMTAADSADSTIRQMAASTAASSARPND